MKYNSAFFGLYENWFKIIKEEFGEKEALRLFRKVMETGLESAYGKNFKKGDIKEFIRLVGERDLNVGLNVVFEQKGDNKFIYRFYTNPFPNLKGLVNHHDLDDTYISFKIKYILGNNWTYSTTAHLWEKSPFTEFVISKMD